MYKYQKVWQVRSIEEYSTHLDKLLEDGWEPFTVTGKETHLIWLRKKLFVMVEETDIDEIETARKIDG
jgi:hypothetical protein